MWKRVAFMAAVVGLVLVGLQVPAQAQRVTVEDEPNDAKPRFDITRVIFKNNSDGISAKAHFADLSGSGTQIFGINFRPKGASRHLVASAQRNPNGSVTTGLWRLNGDSSTSLACKVQAQWEVGRDVVKLRVPQRCLAKHGRVVVTAYVDQGDGSQGAPSDSTAKVLVPMN